MEFKPGDWVGFLRYGIEKTVGQIITCSKINNINFVFVSFKGGTLNINKDRIFNISYTDNKLNREIYKDMILFTDNGKLILDFKKM